VLSAPAFGVLLPSRFSLAAPVFHGSNFLNHGLSGLMDNAFAFNPTTIHTPFTTLQLTNPTD
jgi:hypothetical protein